MTSSHDVIPMPSEVADVFSGGGEMGALMRALDWSQTPLGPPEIWSPSLRMMVRILLANRFPLLLWWGPDYVSSTTMRTGRCWARSTRRAWAGRAASAGRRSGTSSARWSRRRITAAPATWMEDIFLGSDATASPRRPISPSPTARCRTTPCRAASAACSPPSMRSPRRWSGNAARSRCGISARASSEAKTAEEACDIAAAALAAAPEGRPVRTAVLARRRWRARAPRRRGGHRPGDRGPPRSLVTASDEGAAGWPLVRRAE